MILPDTPLRRRQSTKGPLYDTRNEGPFPRALISGAVEPIFGRLATKKGPLWEC
eukprot:NODE_1110_length_1575_cov_3.880734_g785_i1.p6 GENE.NODE_1110_length_1575_cov_3.880734_g785_i1~~NODE_1110_length_1575_cov_3.880734_g785_i1.p6  ORF type:complete len:54 (+),score=2.00 NODE_1110_length_1575_cov_3.880734_g785_i1:296-457(+)